MIHKFFERIDQIFIRKTIIFPVLIVLAIGLLELYFININNIFQSSFFRQLLWILIGLLVIFLSQYLKIKIFFEYAYHLYFLLIVLLVITNSMDTRAGVSRWFTIGVFSFQPSEIGKFILVLSLSRWLATENVKEKKFKYLFGSILMCLLPFVVIIQQPDLGTSIIYIALVFPMLLMADIGVYMIFVLLSPIISSILVFNLTLFSGAVANSRLRP